MVRDDDTQHSGSMMDPVGNSQSSEDLRSRLVEFTRDFLIPAETNVSGRWKRGTSPKQLYVGECIDRAFKYLTAHAEEDGLYVVHGEVGIGEAQHAWVELPNGVLFDGVLQRFYNPELYCKLFPARPFYKYAKYAAVILSRQLEEDGSLPFFKFASRLKLDPYPSEPIVMGDQETIELMTELGLLRTPKNKKRKGPRS